MSKSVRHELVDLQEQFPKLGGQFRPRSKSSSKRGSAVDLRSSEHLEVAARE